MHYKVLPVILLVTWLSAVWTAPVTAQDKLIIAAFGDSLSAGYQLPPEAAFPNQLQKALSDKGIEVEVQNAAVSGDTASGGLSRLDWSIGPDVKGVILELGANDALRGIDPKITREAMDAMIARFKERGIEVLLAGMVAPPNLGPDFETAFNSIYPDLAAKHEVDLYPFFLDGVATIPALNLPDRLHPTEEGVGIIVERILPNVEAMLDRINKAS
ncbi:MAG: arylesterase [Hyphomicrobiales bacterium]